MQTASFSALLPALAVAAALLPAQPAHAELEFSGYGGLQWAEDNVIRSATLGDDRVTWRSEPLTIPTYWGLRAAWWPNEARGYGLTFTHAKAFADDPAKYGYKELNFSHGLNYLTADFWHRFEPRDGMTPYFGLGLGISIPHVEVEPIGKDPTARYQIGGPAVSLIVGTTKPVTEHWSIFTEFQTTWSEIRVELDSGDRLNSDFVTHAVNIGLSYRF